MEELKRKLSGFPEKIVKNIYYVTKTLKDIYTDDVESIVLFGSAVTSDYVPKHSNINLMVVLKDVNISLLKKCKKCVGKWQKSMIVPLFVTTEFIKTSLDTFSLEYSDIIENHIVLYGKDPFSDLKVDEKHLRIQIERELKTNLTRLQQSFLYGEEKLWAMRLLLVGSFASYIHLFRGLLKLKGIVSSIRKEEVINTVAREFSLDSNLLKWLLDLKQGKQKLTRKDIEEKLEDYLNMAKALVDIADNMKVMKSD